MNDTRHYRMYIDGEWVDTDSHHQIHAPATGEVSATVAHGTVEHTDRAVEAAARAHRDGVWRNKTPQERADILERMHEILLARTPELAELVASENGACVRQGTAFHVGVALGSLHYSAETCRTYPFEEDLGESTIPLPAYGIIRHEPVGVVAAILPFNFPMVLGMWKIGPALAAGNTMVVKPDEDTPLTLIAVAEAAHEAGLPPGVLRQWRPRPTTPAVWSWSRSSASPSADRSAPGR